MKDYYHYFSFPLWTPLLLKLLNPMDIGHNLLGILLSFVHQNTHKIHLITKQSCAK